MNRFIVLLFLLSLNLSCAQLKQQLVSEGDYNDAIKNAIIDFSNTNLYKKGKVFKVNVEYPSEELILVEILEDFENKYLYSKKMKIEENILPSEYYEQNNKLFIWWNNNNTISKEMFSILEKYDMLKDDEGGWINILDPIIDDKKKGAKYFFCKNNLKIYKRIITNLGFIPVPKVKCG